MKARLLMMVSKDVVLGGQAPLGHYSKHFYPLVKWFIKSDQDIGLFLHTIPQIRIDEIISDVKTFLFQFIHDSIQ